MQNFRPNIWVIFWHSFIIEQYHVGPVECPWSPRLGPRDWPFRNNEISVQEWTRISLNTNAYRTDTKLNRIVEKAEFVFYKYIFWKPLLVDKEPTVRTTCSTCGRKIEGSNIVNNNKSLRAFCGKTRFGTGKKMPQFNRSRKIFCSFWQIGHTFIIEHVILL